ncbi:hypothetical protein OAP74_00215 [bacterium]|nr:hypothetical protein [bacterium]
MAQQTINVGATANDGTGDGIRTAYIKCNDNFNELYNTTITPTSLPNGTSNVSVADSANVTISIAGSANVVNFAGSVSEFTGNITATGDISSGNSLTVTQDVTIGDQLIVTGTFGSNVLPDTNNTRYLGNATLRFAEMNSVLISAIGNITSTANISGSNIIATQDVIIAGQHVTTGNVTSSGNISGGNLLTGGRVVATGNVVSSANVSGLNLVTTGAGNVITAGFFKGDGGFLSNVTAASNVAVTQIANGTSVVGISSSGGNVELTSGGTLAFQTNGTNLDILIPTTSAANVTTTANVSGGNLLTGGRVVATGNIVSSGNVSGTNFLGNGSFLTGIATTSISNGTSNVTVASGADTTVGVAGSTILTVSSTGTAVTGLMTATGNITATGNVAGGNVVTAGAVIGATVAGDGSALTALNGTNIASGTVAAARVATLNQNTTGSAATLTTARAIALSGDVVGTADFDGSAGISIATTIQSNSVALGTDTTGNYVTSITNGSFLTGGDGGSESAALTLAVDATDANTASKVIARDVNGSFSANIATLTATQAQYADIAEKYLADAEYDSGTVVCVGGPVEVTICGADDVPAGVVTTDPAFLMNKDLEGGLGIALVGRVPVSVFGVVDKGDLVYTDIHGRASRSSEGNRVGIALESSTDEGLKLIECMLKV